jgi:cytochrome c-type biogenesis protein CcmE
MELARPVAGARAAESAIAHARTGDPITITGVIRSVRCRPWAGDADIVAVVADGTEEITVVLHGVGPLGLTAGVGVTVRGTIEIEPHGAFVHDADLRALEAPVVVLR